MMINGITLLETRGGSFNWYFTLFAIISILLSIAFILLYQDKRDKVMIVGFIMALVAALTSMYVVIDNFTPTYKVLIDNSVSFIDFNSNYYLVNHKDNSLIYEIKEKN